MPPLLGVRSPGPARRALLSLRPWRRTPARKADEERPLWQDVALLYACLVLIVCLMIGLSFLAARLFAGSPY